VTDVIVIGGFSASGPDDRFALESPFLLARDGEPCDVVGLYRSAVDPSFSFPRLEHEAPPYVCYALQQLLRGHGLAAEMVFYLDAERDRMARIFGAGPTAVFLSTTLLTAKAEVARAAAIVRAHLPETPIVCGGPFVDRSYRLRERAAAGDPEYAACAPDFLFAPGGPEEACGADLFVIGDPGLDAAARVVRELERGRSIAAIPELVPNCARHDGASWIFSREIAFAPPPLVRIDWGRLAADELRATVPIVRSAGCGNRCRFCNFVKSQRPAAKDDAALIDEIRAIAERGGPPRRLCFCDDNICADRGGVERFLDALGRSGAALPWTSFFDARFVDERLAEALARSRCLALKIGMESADDGVLAAMGKPCRARDYRRAIAALAANGICADAYFVVGYPGETAATLARTADAVNAFAAPTRSVNQIMIFPFVLAPFAPVFERAARARHGLKGRMHEWAHATMDSAAARAAVPELMARITSMQPNHGNLDKLLFNGSPRLAEFDRIRGGVIRERLAGRVEPAARWQELGRLAATLVAERGL
jgi:p-methyltransferase